MPVYAASPSILYCAKRGSNIPLFAAEAPTPGAGPAAASIAVALTSGPGEDNYTPFAVDGFFSAAPGAFALEVQVSNTNNTDTAFQTISGGVISAVDAVNQTFHLDAPTVTAKFMRLLLRTRTNAVNLTASVSG